MKREMTKLEFEKRLAVLAVALACVCMWGCMGCSDEKVIDSGTSIGRHFYMVDDSTIMLDFFNWETVEFYSSYIHGQDEETRALDDFALVVNANRNSVYNRIEFPKTKTKKCLDQILDSLIFYYTPGDDDHANITMLAVWKYLEDKTVSYLSIIPNFIDHTDYLSEFRNGMFKNKRILSIHDGLRNVEFQSRWFYIWDIAENSIARWEPTGESAWIAECNDIRWTEERFRCLDEKNGKILMIDENKKVLDSLQMNGCGLPECFYNSLRFYGNYIGVGHQVYKMYENGEIGDKSLFEIYFEEFTSGRTVLYPSSGDTVYYSEEVIK